MKTKKKKTKNKKEKRYDKKRSFCRIMLRWKAILKDTVEDLMFLTLSLSVGTTTHNLLC
jgi:hypothetical protein